MSFGNYKPTSGDEHGEVLCWASNDLGEQSKPCVFHVVPLGTPQPPIDCQVGKDSILSLFFISIDCWLFYSCKTSPLIYIRAIIGFCFLL